LTLLFTLEEQRRLLLAEAGQMARQGDWETVLYLANEAHWLRPGPDSSRLLASAYLLLRDFPMAWRHYSSLAEASRTANAVAK
jgi:hypothetical protein